jgi:cytoskeletal protein RodZ
VRKRMAILLIAAWTFFIAGCTSENTSPPAATQSESSSATQIESASKATSNKPTSPAVASPSSAPSKAVKEPDKTESSTAPTPSPTPEVTVNPAPKSPDTVAPAVDNVTFSIEGNAKWGTVIAAESVVLATGDTAAGVLKRVAKAHRLSYEIRGSGEMTYVEGIDGLYEFDDGPTSGWKFRVNGIVPDIGAGAYKLKPGDLLEWFYPSEDAAAQEDKESAP